jgi:hypothetical protein
MYLYTNANGRRVTTHSYSGGATFSACPRLYRYQRVDGWKENTQSAAMEFGNAWEAAIQFYHSNPDTVLAREEWRRLWTAAKDMEIKYKESESWQEMYYQGDELLRLYVLKLPDLPIVNPRFQLNFKKEVFPDSEYAGIEDTSFIDMLVEAGPAEHILLPPIQPSARPRPLLIDIKTSGLRYPADARMLRLDPQLRRYSWTTGIETVAFLVGVKNTRSLSRGNYVTLLDNAVFAKAGADMVVFDVDDFGVALTSEELYRSYQDLQKGVRGKALDALKAEFARAHCFSVRSETVTRQQIQFLATVISENERFETGETVGHEIQEICAANIDDFWPQHPGVRFPANRCVYCAYLGLCIDDSTMVKNKLVNILAAPEPPAPVRDWTE